MDTKDAWVGIGFSDKGDKVLGRDIPLFSTQAAQGDSHQKSHNADDEPYSIFNSRQKLTVLLLSSASAFLSPTTASIFWPAMTAIASDLHVTINDVNWTVTSYMIFQAITPALVVQLADRLGRRPCVLFCLLVYLSANIGLSLANSYVALLLLRMVQSLGASPLTTLGSASSADIATTAQRGKYSAIALLGVALGPTVSPILGGVMAQTSGWRSIFWFLAGLSGLVLLLTSLFLPETARAVVGNGSITPPRWNMPLSTVVRVALRRVRKDPPFAASSTFVNPYHPRQHAESPDERVYIGILKPLSLLVSKHTAPVIFFGAIGNAASYFVTSAIPLYFGRIYHLSTLGIGLCYLPGAVGSVFAVMVTGRLVDWNFRRVAHLHGRPVSANRQQDIGVFPIEKARLQVALPMAYVSCAAIIVYGWIIQLRVHVAGPLVLLFIIGFCNAGSLLVLPTLAMDLYPESSAAVSAATNLSRCGLGAGAVVCSLPLISALGHGWANTIVALIWAVASIAPLASTYYGPKWRSVETKEDTLRRMKKDIRRIETDIRFRERDMRRREKELWRREKEFRRRERDLESKEKMMQRQSFLEQGTFMTFS